MIYTIEILNKVKPWKRGIEPFGWDIELYREFRVEKIGNEEIDKNIPFLQRTDLANTEGTKQIVQLKDVKDVKDDKDDNYYNELMFNCFDEDGKALLYTINGEFYLYHEYTMIIKKYQFQKNKLYKIGITQYSPSVRHSAIKDSLGHTKSAYERAIGYYDSSEKPPTGGKGRLESLTIKELQQRCIKRHIPYSGKRKAELIALLRK